MVPKFVALSAIFASSLCFSNAPARAWDSTGHLIVAAIAQKHLPKELQEEAAKLANALDDQGSYNSVTIACWLDDIRTFTPGVDFKPTLDFHTWHFEDEGLPG